MLSRLRTFIQSKQIAPVLLGCALLAGSWLAFHVRQPEAGLALLLAVVLIILLLAADVHHKVGRTIRLVNVKSVTTGRSLASTVETTGDALLAHLSEATAAIEQLGARVSRIEDARVSAVNEIALLRTQLATRLDRTYVEFDGIMTDLRRSTGRLERVHERLADQISSFDENQQSLMSDQQSLLDASDRALAILDRLRSETISEIDALLQIHRRLHLEGALPLMGGWAMFPKALLETIDLVVTGDVRLIVECGSGTSTVYIAKALQQTGNGRLVALEHSLEFAALTTQYLSEHGLEGIAEVRHAPLVELEVDGTTYEWYDTTAIADLDKIDMVIVDGPPQQTGSLARYPAYPVLRERLSDRSVFVVDDFLRPDERRMVKMWLEDPRLSQSNARTGNYRTLYFHATPSRIPHQEG